MSPAISALTSVGITQSMLILGIMFVLAAVVIGMYWQIILPGAVALGVAFLFIGTPDKPEVVEKPGDDEVAYMEDCVVMANYNIRHCQDLWHNRQVDEEQLEKMEPEIKESKKEVDFRPVSEVKLLQVDNKEYKERRAEALKKPNAVVAQYTFR